MKNAIGWCGDIAKNHCDGLFAYLRECEYRADKSIRCQMILTYKICQENCFVTRSDWIRLIHHHSRMDINVTVYAPKFEHNEYSPNVNFHCPSWNVKFQNENKRLHRTSEVDEKWQRLVLTPNHTSHYPFQLGKLWPGRFINRLTASSS